MRAGRRRPEGFSEIVGLAAGVRAANVGAGRAVMVGHRAGVNGSGGARGVGN
jgi:hypothetical protein